MDRLTSMSVFVRVAEAGGFAAAAKELGMSPAMVAKHIQAIEARLGARLLHRTTRRQSLTDVGQLYLARARTVLADFDAAEAAGSELQSTPRGTLRVTAPVVLGAHGLAPLLASFRAACPDVQVELMLHDRVVDLMDEGFDVALRSGAISDPGVVARPLRPLRMLLCAAPDYLRQRGVPRRPADLSRHECLGFAHWVHKDRWRLIGPKGEEVVRLKSAITINNGEALRQAALAGAGIVMQSELLLQADLDAGRLVRVLPRHAPPERPAHLLYLPDRRPSPKLQRFVAHVLAHLGPGC
ncbi:LysR substrate-binding domain-containing protein [Ideonella sp. BN130291]|uniref:LysR substrate-binding domain-containing protein n=1 Tax=Ideonella sp. BN130291 TaxID=3112940 RepID=UPI002E25BEB5|nr:LysR substrate-binding domain-containing protein [Ideonella sp. BN130291]